MGKFHQVSFNGFSALGRKLDIKTVGTNPIRVSFYGDKAIACSLQIGNKFINGYFSTWFNIGLAKIKQRING